MNINSEERIFNQVFSKADTYRELAEQGMSIQDIALVYQEKPERVQQLIRMSQVFPMGVRIYNVPIGIYQAAALFPEPAATVERAWANKMTPEDLYKEIERWAWRFDVLGYGDPPCLTMGYVRQRKTPLEEALDIDEEGNTTARKLYGFLELNPAHYSRWVRQNIEENIFAEPKEDYEVFTIHGENPLGGRPTRDYKLTARFAKKLAMASNSPKGEMVRDYFITVEERAKALSNGQFPTGKTPAEILLGVLHKYGDRLEDSTLNRIVKLALPEA